MDSPNPLYDNVTRRGAPYAAEDGPPGWQRPMSPDNPARYDPITSPVRALGALLAAVLFAAPLPAQPSNPPITIRQDKARGDSADTVVILIRAPGCVDRSSPASTKSPRPLDAGSGGPCSSRSMAGPRPRPISDTDSRP